MRQSAYLTLRRYCFYLFFQLKTHNEAVMPAGEDAEIEGEARQEVAEGPTLSLFGSIGILTIITGLVAASSEYVGSTTSYSVSHGGGELAIVLAGARKHQGQVQDLRR